MAYDAFRSTYGLTQPFANGSRSALNHTFSQLEAVAAGVYNEGELTLLADSFGMDGFSSWPKEVWQERAPVAVTAFGDFFMWNPKAGQFEYVEVQRQKIMKSANEPELFLQSTLINPSIRRDVLRSELVRVLISRLSPLGYGKCFILEPWQMLGGTDSAENYVVGDVEVYVNLVGQAVFDSR